MAEVTFPVAYGGDGQSYTDDADPNTGLDGTGYITRFVPCLSGAVKMAVFAKGRADAAQEFAATCQQLRDQAATAAESASTSANKASGAAAATENALEEAEARIGSSQALAEARDSAQANATATAEDRTAVASHRQHVDEQRAAVDTAVDQVATDRQTVIERADQVASDRQAVADNATQVATDRQSVTESAAQVATDRQTVTESATQVAADRQAAEQAAGSVDAEKIMHVAGSGLPNEVGTAATRNVGTEGGSLMEVGAFGLGAMTLPNWPFPEARPENPSTLQTGFYRLSTAVTGLPAGFVYATAEIRRYSPDRLSITLFAEGNASSVPCASASWRADTGWTPWDIAISGSNIQGTIEFDGNGFSIGGVFESGSGSDGSYFKFLNGLLVCTTSVTLGSSAAFDAIYISATAQNEVAYWDYPHPFKYVPHMISGVPRTSAGGVWLHTPSPSPTRAEVRQLSSRERAGNYDWNLTAIGRWL